MVFWYCVVISKIVLFLVYFVCFHNFLLYFVDGGKIRVVGRSIFSFM